MSWTDDRIGTLKKMWQQGKSASEIAEKLGGVTRNAVIGKAHRLGLSGRPSPIKKVVKKTTGAAPAATKKATAPKTASPAKATKAAPAATKPSAASASAAVAKKAAVEAPVTRAPLPPRQTISVGTGPGKPPEIIQLAALANATSRHDGSIVTILELNERICRWPVGDPKEPNFGYCGSEAYEGHPYCAEHVAIAFQAPNRKDKKVNKVAKETADDADEDDLEDIEVEIEDDDNDTDDTLTDDLDDDDTPVVV